MPVPCTAPDTCPRADKDSPDKDTDVPVLCPRHRGLTQPFPISSCARARLGPAVTAPVSILCWHILVLMEDLDPGSHHPCPLLHGGVRSAPKFPFPPL